MSEIGVKVPHSTDAVATPPREDEVASLRRAVLAKLTYAVGKDTIVAAERDWFVATALAVRDRIVDGWMTSTRATYEEGRKRVYTCRWNSSSAACCSTA